MAGNLTAMIASIFSGSAVTADPYYEYTTLLLPGNGTNGAQNNTFLDGSTNNFTITRNGNTTQGTFSPFSQTGWGNYFGGGASNINLPSSTDFALGGAFSFECWVYQTSIPNQVDLLDVRTSNEVGSLGISSTGFPRWQNGPTTGSLITGSTALTANQWNYLLFVADASGCSIYLNGTRGVNTSQVATWPTSARPCFIAGSFGNASGGSLNGYVSDVRLIKGSTPYSSTATTVTVPTGFLPFVTNTVLQCCKSNRFVNTVSGTSMTTNGTTSVQAFSPFNPTASWSAATNGGSGYFDGNGDSVNAASNAAFAIGTGDFTIEAWIYPISFGTYAYVFGVPVTGGLVFSKEATNFVIRAFNVGDQLQYATLPALNTWTHVAASRSGTTLRMFYNGVQVASTTNSYNFAQGAAYIGNENTNAAPWNGYISNFRLVKGTAVYTSNFTPPTAPLTAITNTSLLLNFTNAGIYDATSKNDLETVGNAQISTTQSKWGGSSIYVDGTGDRLFNGISSPLLNLSSGDWTIESWVYFNAVGAYAYVLNIATAPANPSGLVFGINNSSRIYIGNGAVLGTNGNTTLSTGQWYYLAAVKSGSNVTLYVNGTADVTPFAFTPNSGTYLYVGADASAGNQLNAYLQDVRITRYARPITASPTAAFPTL
jgi:hypothetical protein